MAKLNSWYTGLSYTARLIIAIIFPVGWIVHAIARITSGNLFHMIFGILSIVLIYGIIFDFFDLITIILYKKLWFC